jgi:uncharacterized protein YdiU (UPF0061 family)
MNDTLANVRLFHFDNTYARLPERFYASLPPTPVAAPKLLCANDELARELGLDPQALHTPDALASFAGNRLPRGAEPLAQAYAGHQFGNFVPSLGDGRAILLGEIVAPSGRRFDIQLKGSGPTPFSRRGDGRAALGPVLREYLISEAMAALGIATTRTLAALTTGERVFRETVLPGAIMTRVAASHIRVGTFQYFAARNDTDAIRILADYAIARHDPELVDANDRYARFLDAVVARQAKLVARWMHIGFIHGVMNTDNTTVSGETIDYGPCAFMDTYDPATVYSSIDQHGRYRYENQPGIVQWNLVRLAETLLPLIADDETAAVERAQAAVNAFPGQFQTAYEAGLRAKLGFFEARDGDLKLAQDLLTRMAANRVDLTLFFRRLADCAASVEADAAAAALFLDATAFATWVEAWRARLGVETTSGVERRTAMRRVNPAFIPRNHRVEDALKSATQGDLGPFERMLSVVRRPYDDQPEFADYQLPPRPHEVVKATFCGT